MHGVFIVAIVFGGLVLGLAVIGATIVAGIRILKGGGLSANDRAASTEETRMIQELYRNLPRLQERIEALETLLMDRDQATNRERRARKDARS